MSLNFNKLNVIRHFISKGPGYHLLYLRWKLLRISQRIFPFSYRSGGQSTGSENGQPLHRQDPKAFFFTNDLIDEIVSTIPEDCCRTCIENADRLCDLEFSFRQARPVRFDGEIDWLYAPDGNKDWRWDLNRHAYFETLGFAFRYTGDEKYATAFVAQLESWLRANPPRIDGPNWSSAFEVGFRINSWIWAFFLFRDAACVSEATLTRLLNGIEAHCQFLSVNLELHARNNHLLLEAKALLLAAMLFPQFKQASKWEKRTRHILYREIRQQVHNDGMHGELSTHYHRVISGELLELLVLHRINNIGLPDDIQTLIRKMVEYEIGYTRPDHTIPLLGDSSQQDTYLRFSAAKAGPWLFDLPHRGFARSEPDEATVWRLARISAPDVQVSTENDASSQAYPVGGAYLMRCGGERSGAMYLNIDCGPFGLSRDPHHGHADALSIDLFARGRSWIVDSGVYSTHADWPWRKYFRGTQSHNTVVVDGLDQSVLLDSRRVMRTATASCSRWITSPAIDYFEGSHDGYERLAEPITHRRNIWFVRNSYWLILDSLTGSGEHTFESLFHFQDDLNVQLEADSCHAVIRDRATGCLTVDSKASAKLTAAVVVGQTSPVQGWRSENSGQKSPAATLIYRAETVSPLYICTVIVPSADNEENKLTLRLVSPVESQDDSVSASVVFDEWTDHFFYAPGAEQKEHQFATFRTRANVAFVRQFANEKSSAVGFCDNESIFDQNDVLIQPSSDTLI